MAKEEASGQFVKPDGLEETWREISEGLRRLASERGSVDPTVVDVDRLVVDALAGIPDDYHPYEDNGFGD